MKGNGKTVTLKEASKITGLKVQALRMRIKSGKLEAFKNPSKHGESWLIKADSLKKIEKVDNERLNGMENEILNGSGLNRSILNGSTREPIIEVQREHIGTLQKTLQNYEGLLTTFQARITILEGDKVHLEDMLKLLPAPIEEVSSKLEELERTLLDREEVIKAEAEYRRQLSSALHSQEARLIELEAELREAKKPWWKRILRVR